ncbi:hypothetical protein CBS147321_10778 [Aspergillus niger]|nr:hypothetical protein CBS147321_10778 [Aspergillus niger]KAI3006367.1 hypothetical protein CBS147482_5893 [Aspergillus niger]KAI3054191.1 hypothetical protein CBS147352_3849 [Aspergillus niger]
MTDRLQPRVAKSCDNCKARKTRCIRPPSSTICTPCQKRKVECHYSLTRRQLRPKKSEDFSTPATVPSSNYNVFSSAASVSTDASASYVDQILVDKNADGRNREACSIFKARENQGYQLSTTIVITPAHFFLSP